MDVLDDHDMRRFAALLSRDARQWRRSIDEALRPQGLTEATWLPLLHLVRAEGPLLQKELAQALMLDSSSVVRLLDGLEAAGLVERTAIEDRRAKAVRLTDAGRATVVQVERVVDDARRRYLADVSADELAVALRVLEKVAAALGPAAATATPEVVA